MNGIAWRSTEVEKGRFVWLCVGLLQTPSPPAITQASPPLPQQVVKPQPRPAPSPALTMHTAPAGPPTSKSSPGTTVHVPMEVQEEEVTIRISRSPGMGLGISIAGGKGSTAYRGDDEVSNIHRSSWALCRGHWVWISAYYFIIDSWSTTLITLNIYIITRKTTRLIVFNMKCFHSVCKKLWCCISPALLWTGHLHLTSDRGWSIREGRPDGGRQGPLCE